MLLPDDYIPPVIFFGAAALGTWAIYDWHPLAFGLAVGVGVFAAAAGLGRWFELRDSEKKRESKKP